MTKIFLNYNTVWGEQIFICIGKTVKEMDWVGDGNWTISMKTAPKAYAFEVHKDGTCIRKEWKGHKLAATSAKDIVIRDRWIARPSDSPLYTSMFTDGVFKRESHKPLKASGNVTFSLLHADIRPDQVLAVCGSGKAFSEWQKAMPMDDSEFPLWKLTVEIDAPTEYKFVIADKNTGKPLFWENGDNRFTDVPQAGSHLVIAEDEPKFNVEPWRGAGTAVPVFSLRSQDSFGVGDFGDLKKFALWAASTGQSIIQILPINDTTMTGTWQDSYPYNANSIFALHPQFIDLKAAGVVVDKEYEALQKDLNSLPSEDYKRVNDEKTRLLRKAFDSKGKQVLNSCEYQKFLEDNRTWLIQYAVFCCLRDEHKTVDFSKWGSMARYSDKKVKDYYEAHKADADFWCWEQYLLDSQLKDAVSYAHSLGVALKGDLPIGISRTSVDAWATPELFNMDSQAGAPPDFFSADGQNWGFPTYNWERMAEDGYSWWKARMKKMNEYFDAYRIDHILGFFRIWEIPVPQKSGLYGHFNPALPYTEDELRQKGLDPSCGLFLEDPHHPGLYHPGIGAYGTEDYKKLQGWQKDAFDNLYNDFFYHRHNQFWKEEAMKRLPSLVDSTDMLTCGEDLGMIPECVPQTMDELNILSLEIQRMPKAMGDGFADPARYPYRCVAATGTHDTETLRGWWKVDRNMTCRFYHDMLHLEGEVPADCEPWICERIIAQHLDSKAMLVILPLQDWLAIDGDVRWQGDLEGERINVPATSRYYWKYRMHITIEQLIGAKDLNSKLLGMVRNSGR